jgi:hypothetical protein
VKFQNRGGKQRAFHTVGFTNLKHHPRTAAFNPVFGRIMFNFKRQKILDFLGRIQLFE